jgi:uncharacterized membrane protein HdeD (DUF308 family)
MGTYGPAWKVAVIGGVAVIAGVALALRDWSLTELVVFLAVFFVGRGALHAVTVSFEGAAGALSALLGTAEIAIGVVLLAWPSPTLLVVVSVVGGLVVVRAVVTATVALASRAAPGWKFPFVVSVVELALGVTLIARPGGTVHGAAITLAALALVAGGAEIGTGLAHGQRRTRSAVPTPSAVPAS